MKSKQLYRSRFVNRFTALISASFALLGASVWAVGVNDAGLSGVLTGTVIGGASLVLAIRAMRAGLLVSDSEVVLRGYFRTRRVRWSQILRFDTDDSSAPIGGLILSIERADGKRLRFPELWSLNLGRAPTPVDVVVADLNARLARMEHRRS